MIRSPFITLTLSLIVSSAFGNPQVWAANAVNEVTCNEVTAEQVSQVVTTQMDSWKGSIFTVSKDGEDTVIAPGIDNLVTTLRVVMQWGRSASSTASWRFTRGSSFRSLDAERPGCITTRSVVTRLKDFPENSTVKLVAFTSKGSIFTGWGGACSGTAKKTTVTVNDALTCTANFEVSTPAPEGMYNLTVSVEGDGEGVVTANGINCAGDCQQNHKGGKNLVLKATPDASSTFVGWGGDCEGTKSPLQVKLEQDLTCVATFQSK